MITIAGGDGNDTLIAEAAGKALAQAAPHRGLTSGSEDAAAIARRHWGLAVEMGWPGMLVAEEQGGLGMDLSALVVLAEEMGRHLFCGPFTTTAVLVPSLLRGADVLGTVARGEMIVSLAATSTWTGDEASVSAQCDLVEHPDLATHFLLLDHLGVALIEKGSAIGIAARQAFDVTCPVAQIAFDGIAAVPGTMVRRDGEEALAPLHVAIAAELVGIAQAALDRAVAYARERRQFGAAIGSFQAIKHKLADAAMLVANARLAVRHAAAMGPDLLAVHAARVLAGDAALRACGDCIQVQGGLGFSWENDAHLYLKRARRLVSVLGSATQLRRAVADRFIEQVLTMPATAA